MGRDYLPLLETLRSPVVGFVTLGLLLYVLVAKGRLPVRAPGVLVAFVVGTALYYGLGLAGLGAPGFALPQWTPPQVVLPLRAEVMPSYTQGLMDLGATVCTPRKPSCLMCPWSDMCVARQVGDPERYPVKPVKIARPVRFGSAYVLRRMGRVWLVRRPPSGLLGGMLGFPGSDWDGAGGAEPVAADWQEVGEVRHTFTHFHLDLSVRAALTAGLGDDIEAARRLLLERDDTTGSAGVIGFCMGGTISLWRQARQKGVCSSAGSNQLQTPCSALAQNCQRLWRSETEVQLFSPAGSRARRRLEPGS